MSATLVPRALAMTYYADGRRDEVAQGTQVYWVCPPTEESEALDLRNATETHARLSTALPGKRVGMLHGHMPAAEKAAVMSLFAGGQMQVLVATTVIEVGVGGPNASLMVIEHAERFGLSQLHQLRGRVGRGAVASVCVLLYTAPLSLTAKNRLRAMAETNDGFEIARRDLDIRGPGEFMGARQSDDALLRFAELGADSALLDHARRVAPRLLAEHPDAAAAQVQPGFAGGLLEGLSKFNRNGLAVAERPKTVDRRCVPNAMARGEDQCPLTLKRTEVGCVAMLRAGRLMTRAACRGTPERPGWVQGGIARRDG